MNKKQLIVAAVLIFLNSFTAFAQDAALVKRVIDGDTVELQSGEKVRLIGIDTPEMYVSDKLYRDSRRTKQDIQEIQKMGRQAYAFVQKLAEGKRVRLEYDVEKKDQYNRTLAYLYVQTKDQPEIFLNAEIVRQGYASVMTVPPNVKYAELFHQLYEEARENHRGLWKKRERHLK